MRVLLADDHELLRDTLVMFLQNTGRCQVECAEDLPSALKLMDSPILFDVVLLDYSMPGMNGLAGLETALKASRGQPVALISGTATRDIAEKALASGAAGFLPKTLSAKSLTNAIKFMAMGEQYAPIDFMTAKEDGEDHPLRKQLTEREFQVLVGLTEGKSNKEIARDLNLTEPTIKLHVKTLYRKVGASNRTQAAMIAKESGVC